MFICSVCFRVEDAGKVAEELKRADAVVLTYACDRPETLDRLSTFWLPELRQIEVSILCFHTLCMCLWMCVGVWGWWVYLLSFYCQLPVKNCP